MPIKLLDFIHDKVGKLERFFDAIIGVEVTLSLVPGHENKGHHSCTFRGNDLLVERNNSTFEEAIASGVEVLKKTLLKQKKNARRITSRTHMLLSGTDQYGYLAAPTQYQEFP